MFQSGPLEGLVVLDLSQVLAGPYCSMGLGDMGARVIKIERVDGGDQTRHFGPPFMDGEATYYLSINRNKESVALDLRAPEVRGWLHTLLPKVDVFLSNMRPGKIDELGFGWEACRAANPRLVWASISAFGQHGDPDWSPRPGYDLVLQGWSGIPSLTGPVDGPPFKMAASLADVLTGMVTLEAILAALFVRERTGRGQRIDTSMLEAQLSSLTWIWSAALNGGATPGRQGNRHASLAPYGTFQARDGWLNIACATDALFGKLADLLGREEWKTSGTFQTNALRVANADELEQAIEACLESGSVAAWLERLDRAGIPAGPIASVDELLAHPQLAARGALARIPHPTLGSVWQAVSAHRLSETPTRVRSAPPLLGQHTRAVLTEFGLPPEELQHWLARGIAHESATLPKEAPCS